MADEITQVEETAIQAVEPVIEDACISALARANDAAKAELEKLEVEAGNIIHNGVHSTLISVTNLMTHTLGLLRGNK